MDGREPSPHHYQTRLTIDLLSSDLQSAQRDVAKLRQLLSEGEWDSHMKTNCELHCNYWGLSPTFSSCTNHTSEKVADLEKPYLPDGTLPPDDPANWEWVNLPENPTYPTKK